MNKLIVPSILSSSNTVLLAERILKVTLSLTMSDPKLLKLRLVLEGIYDRLLANLKNSSKSDLTEIQFELDRYRDRALIAFQSIVYGLSVCLIDSINVKAKKLYAVLKRYGNRIYRLGYKDETVQLLALFKELDLEANLQLITDLALMPYYESLKDAQAKFDGVSLQKSDEKTTHSATSEAATDILKEIYPAMNKLLALIEIYAEMDEATYGDVYRQIVTYSEEIHATARAAQTRKTSGADDDVKTEEIVS